MATHREHPDLSNPEHLSQLTRQLSRRSSRSSDHGYPLGRVLSTGSNHHGGPQTPGLENKHNVLDSTVPENESASPQTPALERNQSGFTGGSGLKNTTSRQSNRSRRSGLSRKQSRFEAVEGGDSDDDEDVIEEENEDEEDLETENLLQQIFGNAGDEESSQVKKNIGLIFEDLTVHGAGLGAAFFGTPAVLAQPFLHPIATFRKMRTKSKTPTRILVDHFSGVVRPGEMVLVLGQPGSGTTTTLRALAGYDEGYEKVEGVVRYGDVEMPEMKKKYRGEVAFNDEKDQHLATLTVQQTLQFAAACRTPRSGQRPSGDASTRKGFVKVFLNVLGTVFGLSHVMGTKVGNDLIRGISGGEKKRVSISEVLACRALVTMWDNSTRGLDSSSAIGYVRSLRALTNLTQGSTLVSLYQASEALYTQFDKVMLIDGGKMLYFGPAEQAVAYFEDLGFEHNPRQTSADYLASCTDPNARIEKDSHKGKAPKNTAEMLEAWNKSEHRKASLADLEDYKKLIDKEPRRDEIEGVTEKEKTAKKGRAGGNYTIPLWRQVYYLTIRQYQLIWGDKTALVAKNGGAIAQALIVGSCFYGQKNNTGSAFSWGGVLFFALLFQALQGLSELSAAFEARAIVMRHKAFAFYSPAAYPLAQMLADVPLIFVQNACFGIILYFMTNLDVDASKFFIFYLIIYFTCLCTFAMYRALAACSSSLDGATAFGGVLLNALVLYSGYVIPYPNMRYYFRWIPYISPVFYGYEALSANQFTGLVMDCAQYVPSGPSYTNTQYGVCAIAGAQAGETTVEGGNYIDASFSYTRRHLWRNVGALCGFFILFLLIGVFGLTVLAKPTAASGSIVEYKRGHAPERLTKAMEEGDAEIDEEQAVENEGDATRASSETANDEEIVGNASVFTFSDVNYTVKVKGGTRDLLQNVQGWVRPGKLTALVGASGAGKTTLLSALSQRLPTATGDFQIDGKPLPPAFQRLIGFVEQADIHEPFSTVREALRFSALLRQPKAVSREDKLAYVEEVIKLLEMEDIAEARIGSGLSIELQKRVTIGVELAAKPALMIFLDEPTSGLDGQGAWNLVRLLRKLAGQGMSILATIHQPSSELFQQFDEVLLLGPGGRTIYFGEIGKDAKTLTGYFESHNSRKIKDGENPAEYMVARAAQKDKGWPEKWNDSEQCKNVTKKIQELRDERKDVSVPAEIDTTSSYAASWATQFNLVTRRTFTATWRDTNYLTGKFMIHVSIALFIGFSFFKLGDAVGDTQARLFALFLSLTLAPPLIQQLQPKFLDSRALWEAREGKSKIYSWVPLIFSCVLAEIPLSMFCMAVYFCIFYPLVGFPMGGKAGICLLVFMQFSLFYVSLGQMLAAVAPNAFVASLLVPLFISILFLFSGVLQPITQMIPFYKNWLPNINPLRWILSALLSQVLHDKPIICKPKEYLRFDPPPGETCGSYMTDFFANPMGLGYIANEQATSDCQYCQYNSGDQYLSTLEVTYAKRWQYVSYVFAFILFNWAMVFILTWAFRTQENPFKKFTASRKAQKTNKAQNEKSKEAEGKTSEKKQ